MKLYKISTVDVGTDEGGDVAWVGTQAEAKAAAKRMQAGAYNSQVEVIEFPIDKPGLLAWLNAHFSRDNG